MTNLWSLSRGALLVGFWSLALVASGCGDSAVSAKIVLSSPVAGEVLTLADSDEDPTVPGLQFDVTGMAFSVSSGTTVTLFIDSEATNATAIPT